MANPSKNDRKKNSRQTNGIYQIGSRKIYSSYVSGNTYTIIDNTHNQKKCSSDKIILIEKRQLAIQG